MKRLMIPLKSTLEMVRFIKKKTIMKTNNNIIYHDLYTNIKKLYLENDYFQIINIKDTRPDVDFLNSTKMHYCEFAEVFAISYIELCLFQKALGIIDNHLQYLLDLGISSEEYFDDLTTFFLMKIEIYEKLNSILKQYRSVLSYINLGGKNNQILKLKLKLEEALFMKYVKINKIIMYVMVGLVLISVFSILSVEKSFLTILTTFGIIWYLLNYIFYKKAKQLFIKVIKIVLL